MAAYDKNVDYSDLIAAEAAKGVNADRQLLAELEAARNAKIAGENLNYAQTNVYTQELGSPPHYYTAEDQSGYIDEIYAAAERQALSALEGAYREQLAAYDSEAAALPGAYREAKNQSAASAAVTQQSMNERFTASGLNSGAQGQAALALGIAAQGELAGLDAERASRLADIESRRAQTKAQYQSAVAQAIAQNEIERANALYQEAVRVDNSFAAIDAELLEQLTASTTAAQAAVSSYVPSGTGTGTGTQTKVLSGYEKTAAQVSGAKTTASKLAIIQNALSSGAITSAQAGLLRSKYGLASAGVITPVSGGGGGKVTAAIK